MEETASEITPASWLVAIGASAGGLEALQQFFSACPEDLPAAFVVIQHLSSEYKSMMDELIARCTKMNVYLADEGMVPEAKNVYLIAPGTTLQLVGSNFKVTPKPNQTFSLPIDIFFDSAAKEYGRHCIGIVLSGTGSDGSRGIRSINSQGGLCIVQDTLEAKFDGMPSSALTTGVVDQILQCKEMPAMINDYLEHPFSRSRSSQNPASVAQTKEDAVAEIIELLRNDHRLDFSEYKPATIMRRIEKRIQVNKLDSYLAYTLKLAKDADELKKLRRELLIPVTRFFRDREVFDRLATKIIPKIVCHLEPKEEIRVWIAGVSTGEEAYTYAMLFKEAVEEIDGDNPIKIFATDVSKECLEYASYGDFPESISVEIPELLLSKYFSKNQQGYRISSKLRKSVLFAQHNLLIDAPFTRMHLVSCRNTLIYFKSDAQKKALHKLQFSLLKEGFLVLGESETLSTNISAFYIVSEKLKIYQRNINSLAMAPVDSLEAGIIASEDKRKSTDVLTGSFSNASRELTAATDILLENFSPSSLLTNKDGVVIHFYGDISSLVRVRHGSAELNLSKLLPTEIATVTAALLHRSRKECHRVISETLAVTDFNKKQRYIKISVIPVVVPGNSVANLSLISFLEAAEKTTDNPLTVDEKVTARIEALEYELNATRASLQSTITELETSNEELQATNEELIASNEELQSSNEELQSVNEELNTVNTEYQEKVGILHRINADLDTMSRAAGIASVFLDQDLRITRYTPDINKLFKLREQDVGRPINEIVYNLDFTDFEATLVDTLESQRGVEREIFSTDNVPYLIRILPYRISSTGFVGVVISCIDISALKSSELLQETINSLPEHIAVLDDIGQIVLVNQAWDRFAKINGDANLSCCSIGSNYLDACQKAMKTDVLAKKAFFGIKSLIEKRENTFTLTYPCHSAEEKRWFSLNARSIHHQKYSVVISHFNITEWVTEDAIE